MSSALRILLASYLLGASSDALQEKNKYPVPSSADRNSTTREIRALLKDEYARRDPAGRRALAEKLLSQGLRSTSDANSCFVLLLEAHQHASEVGEISVSFRAVEKLSELFDLEGTTGVASYLEMKLDTLAKAARLARDRDQILRVAKEYLSLARELAAANDFRDAQDVAKKATPLGRKIRNQALLREVSDFSKGLTELKREYNLAWDVDLSKAIDIGDHSFNLGVGRYLCFVKGNWDKGLEYLKWVRDGALVDAAKEELAGPSNAAEQFSVAEAWWVASQKERTTVHRNRYLTRCRTWCEKADESAEGILKLRIGKRLDLLEELLPGPISLARMIDPSQDGVEGVFRREGKTLITPAKTPWARLKIPYEPPTEYDLAFEVERKAGTNALVLGLIGNGHPFMVYFDGRVGKNTAFSGVDSADGKRFYENSTTASGEFLLAGKTSTVHCSVRTARVSVSVDDRKLFEWKGDFSELTVGKGWIVPTPKALFLGSYECEFHIKELRLSPIIGEGKRTR